MKTVAFIIVLLFASRLWAWNWYDPTSWPVFQTTGERATNFDVADCTEEELDGNGTQVIMVCRSRLGGHLGETVVEHILGENGARFVQDNLDVSAHVLKELLRSRAIEYQVAHLAFRDSIDEDNIGDAWDTLQADRTNTLMGVSSACTARAPRAAAIHEAGVEEFFQFGSRARQRNRRMHEQIRNFVIGRHAQTDPQCLGDNPPLICTPLIERAHLAVEAERGNNQQTLSRVLMSDPALNEMVSTNPEEYPDFCSLTEQQQEAIRSSLSEDSLNTPYCWPAYKAINTHYLLYQSNQESLSDSSDFIRQYSLESLERQYEEIGAIYQEANSKVKQKIHDGLHRTCDEEEDGLNFVLSPTIAASVLRDFPEFRPIYCMLLGEKIEDMRMDGILSTGLQVAGWGATAIAIVSAFVTAGATSPLAVAIAGTTATIAGGVGTASMLGGNLYDQAVVAENLNLSVQLVGANLADPRNITVNETRQRELREQFDSQLRWAIIGGGVGVAAAPAVRLIRAWRAARLINRADEAYLLARAAALTDEAEEVVGQVVRSGRQANLLDEYQELTLNAVTRADRAARREMERLGMRPQRLRGAGNESGMESLLGGRLDPQLRNRTFLYHITEGALPPPVSNPGPLTKAVQHPEMASYIRQLEQKGYRVVVDSSLSLEKGQTLGIFDAQRKIIAINPNSNWQTFIHEFQHVRFHERFMREIGWTNIVNMRSSMSLDDITEVTRRDHELGKVLEWSRRGLSPTAIDETLAVERELEALRAAGYSRFGFRYSGARLYALDHQIQSLKAIPSRTSEQNQMLLRARAEFHLLHSPLARMLGGGTGVTATAVYFREEIGNFMVRMSDGTWRSFTLDDVAAQLPPASEASGP